MKVDISKLMKYPSWASEELGAIDFSDGQDIDAHIGEVMMINKEPNFEELPMEEPTLELKTLPLTLKYVFLDTEQANPVIILFQLDKEQEEGLLKIIKT